MTNYLFAVQTAGGREVTAVKISLSRVSDVTAVVTKEGVLEVKQKGHGVVSSEKDLPAGELTLHRWKANDKLAEPVSQPVNRLDES